MLKNYIKTAFRTLKKNKGFTIINVLGLALGLCVCMLIVFYVIDELGYDTYNTKAERIYRVNNDIKFAGSEKSYAESPAALAAAFKSDFPEIENTVRFRTRGEFKVKKGDQNIQEHRFVYSDSTLFDVFTIPVLYGNPKTALVAPNSVVINETTALKYFGKVNAVGKPLTLNDSLYFNVTAVVKDLPKQSHFNFDFFLSMSSLAESKEESWLSNNFNTYLLLKPGAEVSRLESKFPHAVKKYVGGQLQAAIHMSYDEFAKTGDYFKLTLTSLKDIHLKSNRNGELGANGNIQYVYIFLLVAVFILIIACINFMNLSTARSANRAREVGVRKVLGSARKYLIAQFLAESVMVTLVATIIAVIGAALLLPVFNQMADKELAITAQTFTWLAPVLLLVVIVIGCLAGSYPAFFLSAFQPIDVLKGKLSTGFKGGFLRSFLVVFQFAISIFLIIGTMVIYHQLKFIQAKDLGFNREQVLVVYNTDALGPQASAFKKEITQVPGVVSATMTGFIPTGGWRNNTTFFKDQSRDTKKAVNSQVWTVDEDYIKTMDMKLVQGRSFSKGRKADSTALVINESAARQLGLTNAVDQELYYPMDNMAKVLKAYRIVGVIKDFNFNSLRDNVSPMILMLDNNNAAVAARFNTSNTTTLIADVKKKWHAFSPNQELNYSFMDEEFNNTYRSEQRIGSIFIAFTSMAIIIACLGLFGLAAYAAEQRTKEIGIRKVLGANVSIIVAMLSKDFIKLVVIAIVIASPLAWFSMQHWFLQSFAYRDGIKWWIVAIAGGGALVIAFITISFQSIKAALANPVTSLKNE